MKMKFGLLIALLSCLTLNGLAVNRVKGDGKLTTKQITVEDYNAIKIDNVIDFHYEQSDSPSKVEITVDQNLHQYINIEVKDRVLTIGFKGAKVDHFTKFIVKSNSKWLKEAKINGNANFMVDSPLSGDETVIKTSDNSLVQFKKPVTVGKLDINITGSANVVVEELKADKIECSVDGSGSATLKKGTAKQGEYSILSSGDIHAFGLEVPELSCKVTGSGLAEIHPTQTMKSSVIGKGNIRYKGTGSGEQRVIGKGSIEKAEEK